MSAELHAQWCVLCFHDGSEDELVDVFSMSDLSDRIAEEYEICVNRNELPAKICMPCFQETLNFRKQRRLYEAEKERILKNQNHFRLQNSRGEKLSSSSAPSTFDNALKLQPAKSSKSVTQHPKDSAIKTNDISRSDRNSGEEKVRMTIKLKRKSVPSNNSTNPLEIEKQPVSKNSKTTTDKDKQGFISTNALFKTALESKKRVRFSIQKDADEDSTQQPRKRTKYAESGEKANGVTSEKQSLQYEVENKNSHSRDQPGPANGQQQQKGSNSKKESQKITSKTQRPSASGGEKTVAATASTCADAVRASAVAPGPTTASVPAAVRNTSDTGKSNESGQQKPSNSTKGVGTNNAGPLSDLQNRSAGQVGENLSSLSKTTLIAANGAAPIPLTVFLQRESTNTKSLKRIPKIVKTAPSAVNDTTLLGTFKNTSTTIVTGSRLSATVSTKQTAVSIAVAPNASVYSSSNQAATTVVTSTSVSGNTNNLVLTSNTGQVCTTSASRPSDQNQHHSSNAGEKTTAALELGDTTSASSGALATTCMPPSSHSAADPIHLTSAGQLPTTPVVNATIVGVTGASNNASTADSCRQLLPVASAASPAVITVSECESIYSFGSMTNSFGTLAPASTNTTTVTDMPVATAVSDGLQQRSVITATPTVQMQPTVTPVVFQPASSLALASLQQETTAPGATAASPGAQSSTGGGIKKRRHSTFIRVNPNLFDEPGDQFASIRKNLLIRTAESTVSSLQMSPFLMGTPSGRPPTSASTVPNAAPMQFRVSSGGMLQVSQTSRTQATTTVNINQHVITGNSGAQLRTSAVDLAPVSQIPVHILYKPQNKGSPNMSSHGVMENQLPSLPTTVANGPGVFLARGPSAVPAGNSNVAGSSVRAPVGGQNQSPRFVRILPKPAAQGQAASAVAGNSSNNPVRTGTVGGTSVMSRSFPTAPTGTSACTSSNQAAQNVPPNSNSTQTANSLAQQRPVLMCQLCTEFFLSEASLAAHLNQVHYVEFSRSLYSMVYDESIWKLLVARARRKSIASPDDFRGSR